MPLNGDNCYLSVERLAGNWQMDRILNFMKKNNGHQGIICPFTGAFFHNSVTKSLFLQVGLYRKVPAINLLGRNDFE